jgi:hypothetical protein
MRGSAPIGGVILLVAAPARKTGFVSSAKAEDEKARPRLAMKSRWQVRMTAKEFMAPQRIGGLLFSG